MRGHIGFKTPRYPVHDVFITQLSFDMLCYDAFLPYNTAEVRLEPIFFDGFKREPDATYWTSTGAFWNGYQFSVNSSAVGANKIRLNNIGTHSSGKLYFGVRISNYGNGSLNNAPFIKFYDSANNVVLEFKWQWDTTTIPQPNIGLDVINGSAQVTTYTALNADWILYAGNYFFPDMSDTGPVFEFELDLTNGTLAAHYAGQSMLNLSNAALTTGLTISNIAAIEIFGGTAGEPAMIHEMYLTRPIGAFTNTWLGPYFSVQQPYFSSDPAAVNDWDSLQWDTGTNLNYVDEYEYIHTAKYNAKHLLHVSFMPVNLAPAVAGIRVSSVARRSALNSKYKYTYRDANSAADYDIGAAITLTSGTYAPQGSQFIVTNPATNGQWTVVGINQGLFGVKSVYPD